jgi:hypothetical protein
MKDALGNPIVISQRYGYSRNENGFTYVRVGKVTKINEKSVTMEVEISKRALYNGELEEEKLTNSKISIKSNMLFPVGAISTPLAEKVKKILEEIFEEDSNGEDIENVEIDGEWISFDIYDRHREGTFSNRLKIVDGEVFCYDLHEIWEGGDAASNIEEKLTEFFKNEKL